MRRIAFFGFSLAALLLTACALEEPVRKVTLEPEVALPAGAIAFAGDTLTITVENLETLDADARYVAWGTGDKDVALAELDPLQPLKVAVADLGDNTEMLITEEDAGKALPEKPSNRVRLRGPLGSALVFAGGDTVAFAAAAGTATLTGSEVEVETSGLPELPTGLSYHVWVEMGAAEAHGGAEDDHDGDAEADHGADEETEHDDAADEDHEQDSMAGDSMGDAAMDDTAMDDEAAHDATETEAGHGGRVMDMGALEHDGALAMMAGESMAMAAEVRVTIESAQGTDEMSPCAVFHGEVRLPESSGGAEPAGHTH